MITFNNKEIAQTLFEVADFLDARGDNPFRARAYRRAAYTVEHLKKELSVIIEQGGDLCKIPNIGKVIAGEITSIFKTGILKIAKNTQVKPPRFVKEKPQKNKRFFRLFHIMPIIESLITYLKLHINVIDALATSTYRRKEAIIKEIEILLLIPEKLSKKGKLDIVNYNVRFPQVSEIFLLDSKCVRFRLMIGIIVNIRIVNPNYWGSSLLYHTGSNSHINHLKTIASEKNMLLNDKGMFFKQSETKKTKIKVKSEAELYQTIGLEFIPPELRENRGEIEEAMHNNIPKLISLQDIKGDLHCHTYETDGRESIETMANAALQKGYEYLAITDHSQHLAITNGMDKKRLLAQIKKIDKINARLNGIVILKSIEVDILLDGSLDMPDSVLKELDLTVCSIHSQFRIPEKKQTERILRAMDNPYFTILGHATGRLIRHREPYEIDLERIIMGAKERGCFLELNSQPYRLDIKDIYCKMTKELGVKLAVSSDAHSIRELNYIQYGIFEARRGWLTAEDVLNTKKLSVLKKLIKR